MTTVIVQQNYGSPTVSLPPNRIEENRIEENRIEEEEKKESEIQQIDSASAANITIQNVYDYYEKNITNLTEKEKDKIQQYSNDMSLIVIKAILQEAIESNGKSWKYVEAILQSCKDEQVHTIEQFETRKKKYKEQKDKKVIKSSFQNYDQRDYKDLNAIYINKAEKMNDS